MNGVPDQEFAVGPVEHIKMAVAVGVHQQLALLAAPDAIDEHHVLYRIPVVAVIRRELIVPFQLAGVGVESDHRVAEQVVHLPARLAIELRRGVADRPIHEVEVGIEAAGQPGRPPPVFQLSPFHVSLPNSPGPGIV